MIPEQQAALEFVGRYDQARALRLSGRLEEAEALLLPSVSPPSAYHGHYRELFLIYRVWNRQDTREGKLQSVVERVRRMAELDNELISEMAARFAEANGYPELATYFSGYRKLLLADAKAMLRAAEGLADSSAKNEALAVKFQ